MLCRKPPTFIVTLSFLKTSNMFSIQAVEILPVVFFFMWVFFVARNSLRWVTEMKRTNDWISTVFNSASVYFLVIFSKGGKGGKGLIKSSTADCLSSIIGLTDTFIKTDFSQERFFKDLANQVRITTEGNWPFILKKLINFNTKWNETLKQY